MLKIAPGKENKFRYFQEWLAQNAALDRAINADADRNPYQPSVATDNALSRLIESLITASNVQAPAANGQPVFRRPARGRNTMWVHLYVNEKMRELGEARLARVPRLELRKIESQRPSMFGRLGAIAGRSLRRFGETIELWATPAGERENVRIALARARRSD